MNKETRIKKIEEITSREPFGKQEIPWEDKLESMPTFKVPLEYLIYNKYNGRILSRTMSFERQEPRIDAESTEGKILIEKLLWDSKPDRNEKTLDSIKKYGQEKVGIITKDGVIIDGNRRAMLLKRVKHPRYDYFKAVVLPVTLEENQLEIEKLETTYQMGEDEKLGYNPVEKYLKAKGLFNQLTQRSDEKEKAIQQISEWMGETESTVQEYLAVMSTMDEYLEYLEYDGVYTQLDAREDQFINLTKWLKGFYGEGSSKAFDGYKDSDVDDLKIISFNYIRAKYEGKRFRYIAHGLKENHFFGDKGIWEDFRDFHFEHMESVRNQEESIDFNSENLQAHLNARDGRYFELTKNEQRKSFLEENISTHEQQLRYRQYKDEPAKLLGNAKRALEAIDQKHKAFGAPDVMGQVVELNKITTGMLQSKPPEHLLGEIVDLLESVKVDKSSPNKDELLNKAAEINRLSFEMKKKLGG